MRFAVDWLTVVLVCIYPTFICLKKYLRWRKFVSILDKIPGPKALPLFGNTLRFLLKREDLIPTGVRLKKEFGPIFRARTIFFNVGEISKAEYVEKILTNSHELQKGTSYSFMEPWLGTGLLTSKGGKWFSHRKLLTPAFHFSILETFMTTFNEKNQIFLNKLKNIPSGTEFNIYTLITFCTLDIICDAVMGINMNSQDDSQKNEVNSNYISAILSISEATVNRIFRPWLYPDWVFYNLSSEGKKYSRSLKVLHDFTNKVVLNTRAKSQLNKEHIEEDGDDLSSGIKYKPSFLEILLKASEKEHKLTNEEVRQEVDTFLFEGHDTTTAAINWSVFLLGHHPAIQDKVFEELNYIFHGEYRNMISSDLKEMKYLEMVIKETLRLFPSVPAFDRNLQNDIQLGEYVIPAGADIRINAYNLHRSPEYFENPEIFNPDNFLPDKVRSRHPFAYIPFSAGPRNCIGQKFAMMELKSVLATIFLNFRVESVEKIEDIILYADLILRPKSGLKVKLYPRHT